MSKFKVKITRKEIYEREVEIEADNAKSAIAKAKANYEEGEYDQDFDSFDDVETTYSYAGAKSDREPVQIAPFTEMEIVADVDWDGDEGEELPDRKFVVTFGKDYLKDIGVLDAEDTDEKWTLDEDKLEDYLSDYLTAHTDFCHNGFTYTYSCDHRKYHLTH